MMSDLIILGNIHAIGNSRVSAEEPVSSGLSLMLMQRELNRDE